MTRELHPTSNAEAAAALAAATAEGHAVRIVGGGTKLGWGAAGDEPQLLLRTSRLEKILEHNVGDLTAVLQAGVPVAQAQEHFAAAGQMLALDPPLGRNGEQRSTVGGLFATGDCGPLRHRYGAPRDLILGVTVALADGTIARAGGKVIKNVAGYDLAKLMTGSFGTLALILSVSVRLHPLPEATATACATSGDPAVLGAAARTLARAPLELEALDVAWHGGRGGLLAQAAGVQARRRGVRIGRLLRDAGLEDVTVIDDDERLWARQRAGQRSRTQTLVRVSAPATALAEVLSAAQAAAATLVGRAQLGCSYVEVDPQAQEKLLAGLPAVARAVVLDSPAPAADPWQASDGPALELMRRVKHRFDPARTCNPGVFVGGI